MLENFFVGPYPIYTFSSSQDLPDKILPEVIALDYDTSVKNMDRQKVHFGYVKNGNDLKSFYHKELYDWINSCLDKIAEKHLANVELNIVDMWGVRAKFGETLPYHSHSNSMFSGVFHLSDCDKSEIEFTYPDEFSKIWFFLLAQNLKTNDIITKISPKKGKLYIWPSTLKHRVIPHSGKSVRYSLAFNVFFNLKSDNPTSKLITYSKLS